MSSAGEWVQQLSSPEVIKFIKDHAAGDPFALSLKYTEVSGVPISLVAEQIRSRQKAAKKLPEWARPDCIVFPPPQNLEQASSEITAKFKATLIAGHSLFDLTGGTGIDTYYLSQNFRQTTYVERDPLLCSLARSNFSCLGAEISVRNTDADSFLTSVARFSSDSWCYLDPSRRDDQKNRVISIQDCEPDASRIVPSIISKGGNCMVKLSPMLDIDEAIRTIGTAVSRVYVTAVDNEVRELLLIVEHNASAVPVIHCMNLSSKRPDVPFSFLKNEEEHTAPIFGSSGKYLYESNASVRKAGAFSLPAVRYSLKKASRNTHLYFSDELNADFPGRYFEIQHIIPYLPRKLRSIIGTKKANVTVRNFPESVAGIRKKTGLADGGDTYLFFFTDMENKLKVAVCRKVSK